MMCRREIRVSVTTTTNGHLSECMSCETWNDNLGDTIELKSLGGGIPLCDIVPIPGDSYRTQCERVVFSRARIPWCSWVGGCICCRI